MISSEILGTDASSAARPVPQGPDPFDLARQLAREGAACDAALAELRAFRISDESLAALTRHAKNHPASAGCAALALGARALYNEQLKAYLDHELEIEAVETIRRFEGTQEAEIVRHALSALSDYSTEDELEQAESFFAERTEMEESLVKYPQFHILRIIAGSRLARTRAAAATDELSRLADDLKPLAADRQASIVFRQLRARLGL